MMKGDGDLSVKLCIKMFVELRCFQREAQVSVYQEALHISHLPQCFSGCP